MRPWVVVVSPLLVVTLLLLLLLPTTVSAKKEKPLHSPFPKDVIDAISCDVCSVLVKKAYHDVEVLFAASAETRVRVSEDDVLTAIEDVCNPFTEQGQWIRRLAVNNSADAAPHRLRMGLLPVYTKCKRTCTTVVEACEAIVDHETMDQLTPKLLRLKEYVNDDAFAQALCHVTPFCRDQRGLPEQRSTELRAMIAADVMEEIDPKEMEVERMMDQMERKEKRRHDIFTRDEIATMQAGLLKGDKETVAQVDPAIMDLNDREFAALQAMARGQKGSPHAADQPQMMGDLVQDNADSVDDNMDEEEGDL
ncbi:hypothetical protein DQ04_00141080 [Trypanosoma grayi]|uniref:hypothetical protein n=1 Tax=Trypanosoma grayi TaxID=71804 RepID=UPI0004F40648|nr:hypothetical protein DQ04_00141080 [Trypanosoma grayi]KEG15220.1 hypothetical protein DQ04_00141080 [Trypanosoma grayi]